MPRHRLPHFGYFRPREFIGDREVSKVRNAPQWVVHSLLALHLHFAAFRRCISPDRPLGHWQTFAPDLLFFTHRLVGSIKN